MRSTVISAKTVEECVSKALEKLQANQNEVDIEVIDEPKQGFLGIFGAKDAVVRVSLKDEVEEKQTGDFVKSILSDDFDLKSEDTKEEVISTESSESEKEDIKEESEESHEEELEDINEVSVEEEIEEQKEIDIEDNYDIDEDDTEIVDKNVEINHNDEIFKTSKSFLEQMIKDMGISCDIESRVEGNMIKFNILCEEEDDIGIIIGKRGENLDSLQYIVNLVTNRNSDTYIRVILDCNQYRTKRERSLQKLAQRLAQKAVKTGRDIKLEPMNPYERRIIHTSLQNNSNVKTFSQGQEPNRRVIIKKNN